jgi:hypothetical protein|tara:strand:+ start:206 stop:703 length:498 start_codon:yes stop_codon:yes gene_type:complete
MKKFLLFLFFPAPLLAELSDFESNLIVVTCEQLLADYAIYRDHLEPDNFANTFSIDGELVLGSGSYIGREAIRENITSRPTPGVAHMILLTSSIITPHTLKDASGISYAIVLNGNRPINKGDTAIQMKGITSAVEYHTRFTNTEEGWKISKLELKSIVRGPGLAE